MTTDFSAGIVGYCRLSREEVSERGQTMEEKLHLRREILIAIAKHHAICLTHDQIVTEVLSGGNLSEREGLLGILERCRRREVHTVIAFDVDRLTRDVADLKQITNAFYRGEITLITQRGIDRFTRDHDSTLLQILAVLGEKERRSFSYRRKATNLQRARQGHLSQGLAPYGYRWDADAKRFEIDSLQYPILEEMCRLIKTTGCYSIARQFNERGVPPPSAGKRIDGAKRWLSGTVNSILRNPFYTGRPAKRKETDRDGVAQFLPRSQWTWAEAEQDYPHPLTIEEWEQIQEIIDGRKTGELGQGLLTGLLHCSQGAKMFQHLENYACNCENNHRGHHVSRAIIEPAVICLVAERIDALPATALQRPGRKRVDRNTLASERSQAKRDLREKEATMQELVARASFYHALPGYGACRHQETLTTLGKEVELLSRRVAELDARLSIPDMRQIAPVLQHLKEAGGVSAFFASSTPQTSKRALLRLIVKQIALDPMPEGRGMTRAATITLYPLLDSDGEQVSSRPLIHTAKGKKRGPYLWRRKAPE